LGWPCHIYEEEEKEDYRATGGNEHNFLTYLLASSNPTTVFEKLKATLRQ
jgi:hypothetical protein